MDDYTDAVEALVQLPTPDGPALQWKIDHIFQIDPRDEHHDAWSVEHCAQMLEDCRRILPEVV